MPCIFPCYLSALRKIHTIGVNIGGVGKNALLRLTRSPPHAAKIKGVDFSLDTMTPKSVDAFLTVAAAPDHLLPLRDALSGPPTIDQPMRVGLCGNGPPDNSPHFAFVLSPMAAIALGSSPPINRLRCRSMHGPS